MAKGMLERQKLTNEKVSVLHNIMNQEIKKMSSSQLAYDKDKTKIIAEVALVSFLCVSTRRAVNTEESRTFFLRT